MNWLVQLKAGERRERELAEVCLCVQQPGLCSFLLSSSSSSFTHPSLPMPSPRPTPCPTSLPSSSSNASPSSLSLIFNPKMKSQTIRCFFVTLFSFSAVE